MVVETATGSTTTYWSTTTGSAANAEVAINAAGIAANFNAFILISSIKTNSTANSKQLRSV